MKKQANIFLSYSHKDKKYADELIAQIKPLQQRYELNIHSDLHIEAGEMRQQELMTTLSGADIALVLLSPDYLASDWCINHELPQLLKQAERGNTLLIPVILRPSDWIHTPLAYYQVFPIDAKPLAMMREVERDQVWLELCKSLEARLSFNLNIEFETEKAHIDSIDYLQGIKNAIPTDAKLKLQPRRTIAFESKQEKEEKSFVQIDLEKNDPPFFFISYAEENVDFVENLQLRMEKEGLIGKADFNVIKPGDKWKEEIDNNIRESLALILVVSPDSKASEYVTYEWAFALGRGLKIIPVMIRDTPIHPRLEEFQYLDFRNQRVRPWIKLFEELRDTLKPKLGRMKE
jgi:hypothetical protein